MGRLVEVSDTKLYVGDPRGTVVSAGMADARWLEEIGRQLAAFEPVALREQVTTSWAREPQGMGQAAAGLSQ